MLNDGGLNSGSWLMMVGSTPQDWEFSHENCWSFTNLGDWRPKMGNQNQHESSRIQNQDISRPIQDLEGGWFTGKPSVIFYKWRIRFLVTPACLPCRFLRGGPAQGRTGRGRGDSCGGAPSADVAGHALVPCLGSWASGYWWNLMQSDGFRPRKLEDFSKHRVHRCFWLW